MSDWVITPLFKLEEMRKTGQEVPLHFDSTLFTLLFGDFVVC